MVRCCCCYGSTASGKDTWQLYADTVVINRVKQDNAMSWQLAGIGKRGELSFWEAPTQTDTSGTSQTLQFQLHWVLFLLFFMILRTEWNPTCLHVLKVLQPPIMIYLYTHRVLFPWLSNGDKIYSPLVNHGYPIDTEIKEITCAPIPAF